MLLNRLPTLPLLALATTSLAAQSGDGWRVHEMTRPHPATAAAVPAVRADQPPPGAVVLFDGHGLAHWVGSDGAAPRWAATREYFEARPGAGTISTVDSFGDMQLHLEWSAPARARGEGQDRGNSGVFLMGRYELQVLDSWHSVTYTDGQAGAMYGQHPPLYNASLPPGAWQRYDIIFRRPRFGADGALLAPARVTVFHNGVPVQNNVELFGPTSWLARLPYEAHPDRLPFGLQDHGHKVRFRNVWVRPLPEEAPPPPSPATRATTEAERRALVGRYGDATVRDSLGRLWLDLGDQPMALVATADGGWAIEGVDAPVEFTRGPEGAPATVTFTVGGVRIRFGR